MNELKFRIALLRNRISQNELAKKVGVHPMTLSAVVRGYRKAEGALRRRIASALGVSECTLFGECTSIKTKKPNRDKGESYGKNTEL